MIRQVQIIICLCLAKQLAVYAQPSIGSSVAANSLVCPGSSTDYTVNFANDYVGCTYAWSKSGQGTIAGTSGTTGQTFTVVWDDQKPNKVQVTVVVRYRPSNGSCTSSSESTLTFTHILRSVYQETPTAGSSVNVPYCSQPIVNLTVQPLIIKNTGTGEPPFVQNTEVEVYAWSLPSGWRQTVSQSTGLVFTSVNAIVIEPFGSVAICQGGTVIARGYAGPTSCAGLLLSQSNPATIALNRTPAVAVTPQGGYVGATYGNTSPVTFSAPSYNCATYSWTFPQGWSGSSTSNTISLTPSGCSSDEGNVSVSVNFGSCTVSGLYHVVFSNPYNIYVAGPANVCSAGDTYYLTGAPENLSYNWSATPSNYFVTSSGSGRTANLVPVSGSTNGVANVTFYPNCGANVPADFWVGEPLVNVESGEYYYEVCAGSVFAMAYTPTATTQGITSQLWSCTNCSVITDPYAVSMNVMAPGSGYFTVSLDVYNSCGPRSTGRGFLAVDEIGGQPCQIFFTGGGEFDLSMSPNPASDQLTIEAIKTDSKVRETMSVTVVNEKNEVVAKGSSMNNKVVLETKQLKDGVYYLNADRGNKSVTRRILIRH